MKKILFLSLAICFAFVSGLNAQKERTPYSTQSLAGKSVKEVNVETSGGHIEVAGVTDGEAKIEVYIQGNNRNQDDMPKEEIEKRLQESYDFSISVSGGKLTAIAKAKSGFKDWKRGLSISFKIFAPKEVASTLRTSGGHIKISNLIGTQDFTTSGGHLEINNITGKMKGRTSGGHIQVRDSRDNMDLTTSGGHIEAENCTGDMIKLGTSGGHVTMNNLKGSIDASTSGGSIKGSTISGDLIAHTSGGNISFKNLSCSLETSTSGGNIDVAIKELGKFVKISGSGGHVDLELPKNKGLDLKLRGDKINVGTLANFSGTIEEDNVDGKLNGGGVPVSVRAGSGRISLSLN